MDAIRLDLTAWKHVPWGGALGDRDIVLMGLDWSGGTFAMQIRPSAGDTGTAYVTLGNATAGSEGISATYDASYVHPTTGATVGATRIRPQIAQATLEAVPLNPVDPALCQVLAYDMHVTLPGLPAAQFLYGTFTLNPGVTA